MHMPEARSTRNTSLDHIAGSAFSKYPPMSNTWPASLSQSFTTSQGLTLVLLSAQRKHFLWDTLGTFCQSVDRLVTTSHKLDTTRLTDQNG